MPTISLTLPVSATTITAGLHSANYSTIQTLLNGSLDTSNWASGKIFDPAKLLQGGAATNQVLQWNGSAWVPATIASSTPGYAITLPGSPTDGQEAILVDSVTFPTYQWRFRWNAGSSNTDKWEFIGGNPATSDIATAEATTSTTYAALTTGGPSIALPRAGVYIVEHGCKINVGTANDGGVHSYDIGGTGAIDADSVQYDQNTNASTTNIGVSRSKLKTGLTSVTLASKYKTIGGASITFSNRFMRVTPVRVS